MKTARTHDRRTTARSLGLAVPVVAVLALAGCGTTTAAGSTAALDSSATPELTACTSESAGFGTVEVADIAGERAFAEAWAADPGNVPDEPATTWELVWATSLTDQPCALGAETVEEALAAQYPYGLGVDDVTITVDDGVFDGQVALAADGSSPATVLEPGQVLGVVVAFTSESPEVSRTDWYPVHPAWESHLLAPAAVGEAGLPACDISRIADTWGQSSGPETADLPVTAPLQEIAVSSSEDCILRERTLAQYVGHPGPTRVDPAYLAQFDAVAPPLEAVGASELTASGDLIMAADQRYIARMVWDKADPGSTLLRDEWATAPLEDAPHSPEDIKNAIDPSQLD